MEEEDKPNTSVEEQGMDKGKALVASDTAAVDREENQLAIVSPLSLVRGSENSNIWEILLDPDRKVLARLVPLAGWGNSGVACPTSKEALDGIMEALRRVSIKSIGVYGSDSTTAGIIDMVLNRNRRDELFDVVVKVTISRKPNREIQDEIAKALRLNFDDENKNVAKRSTGNRVAMAFCLKFDDEKKDVAERAKRLRERILVKHRILVILRDLCKGLDLEDIGIPSGADHTGCKLLLTSASEEVLSKEMHAQEIFKV